MKVEIFNLFLFLAGVLPVQALSDAPVVVVGAGPASLMFTLRYLQLNPSAKIEIFERRPRPPRFCEIETCDCVIDDNAFGFGIGRRAQYYLKKIPGLLEAVAAVGHPLQVGGGKGTMTTWMVNRRDFCAEFIHILEENYGSDGSGQVQLHFNTAISAIDRTEGSDQSCSICVKDLNSTTINDRWVPYSLLVGGDGTHSSVRRCLMEKGFITGRRYSSGTTWKALQMPFQPQIEGGQGLSYKTEDDVGRLLPRYQDRFVLLNFRRKKAINPNPFGASSPDLLKSSIRSVMPNVTEFPPDDIIQSFLHQVPGDTYYMILNKIYIPEMRTILIGDAAVGMYSLLGQGCTYAMESAARLAEELASVAPEGPRSRRESTLLECAKANQREGLALANLNLISHIRSKPFLNKVAERAMPNILKGLADPSDPYSAIARRNKWIILLARPFWWFARSRAPFTKRRDRR